MANAAIGLVTVGLDRLDAWPEADGFGMVVAGRSVAVCRDGFRLELDCLPAIVHQQLLGCGRGGRDLREYILDSLAVHFAVDDLAGQRQRQVVAVIAVGGQTVLG